MLTVHLSMLTEQSQTHKNRELIAAVSTLFRITSSVFALLLPLIVQSILPDPENVKWWEPSGTFILSSIPLVGIGFVILGTSAIVISFFSIDESFHNHSSLPLKNISLKSFFPQMTAPLKDKSYQKFLAVRLFNAMSGRILGIIVIPFLTYSLFFTGNSYYIYPIVSATSKFIGFFIWRRILRKHKVVKTYTFVL